MKMYAVRVTTGKEKEVAQLLKKLGIEIFLPEETRYHRRGGEYHYDRYILFPGYVFIYLDLTEKMYYKIKNTTHVIYILKPHEVTPLSEEDKENVMFFSNGGKPIPVLKSLDDEFLKRFNIKSIDKRQNRVKVECVICGEKKQIILSCKF